MLPFSRYYQACLAIIGFAKDGLGLKDIIKLSSVQEGKHYFLQGVWARRDTLVLLQRLWTCAGLISPRQLQPGILADW